ncbi:MAG: GIY-YIG nuclease family protein [Candidatus Wolfebacteria bacterium]|nr:GIY-YIG nuclease family protein [Candidatus Wolfebacteria bacterium]
MAKVNSEKLYKDLPETPGVYLMKNAEGVILYVGKAGNLCRRVSSYFTRPPASNASRSDAGRHDVRIEKLVSEIRKIDFEKTETAIEALILESKLIKKYRPAFNVRDKDDKSFLYVVITKDKFPRVLLSRGKGLPAGRQGIYGPFTSASSIREALRIIRKIFPFSVHSPESLLMSASRRIKKECFDCELGLCPGTCVGAVSRIKYLKNIKNIKLFFEGGKKKIIKSLKQEMASASKKLEFEKAVKLRGQIFALNHIRDIALISDSEIHHSSSIIHNSYRIEGYDISNISGTSATGSMVVFINGKSDRDEYRKFKIRTITQNNDTGMLKEVLERRLKNDWPLPDLILVDGGKGQVNAVKSVLSEAGLDIPVIGIAKGSKRKKNEFIGAVPKGVDEKVLIKVRDEAHRFAISYHKKLRNDRLFG